MQDQKTQAQISELAVSELETVTGGYSIYQPIDGAIAYPIHQDLDYPIYKPNPEGKVYIP